MKVLVTGCAGFIGSSLTDRLIDSGYEVVGIDNFNDYYDSKVKERNLEKALSSGAFKLHRIDILDFEKLREIARKESFERVVHLAARAGVRPSILNPSLYTQVNVLGTVNLLKVSQEIGVKQFIFGSSSSVYGNSKKLPFSEDDLCEDIISPYGSSKRAAEFFVEAFYHSYGLKSVILRLFTVYGPRGRPDMAPARFTKAILEGKPINKYGSGQTSRDYTFIEDVVDGIVKALETDFDFEFINLGSNHPFSLNDFITTLEQRIGKKAKINIIEKKVGDAERTWADTRKAKKLLAWKAKTKLGEGLTRYIQWLKKSQ